MAQISRANRVQARKAEKQVAGSLSWLPLELISSRHPLSLWLWEPASPSHAPQLGTAQGAWQSWGGGWDLLSSPLQT